MKRNTLAFSVMAIALGSVCLANICTACHSCAAPSTYTACRPVTQTCYANPGYAAYYPAYTGWYPGKLIREWRMSRQARQVSYYQPVTRTVPVTAYRPVTSCDPCTGCPVTTYRPVTAMACQTCYMPARAYRPVLYRPLLGGSLFGSACCRPSATPSCCNPCSNYAGTSCSNGCGVALYSQPASYSQPSSCCGSSYDSPSDSQPSTYSDGNTTPQPQLQPETTPSTFNKPVTNGELQTSPDGMAPDGSATDADATSFEPPHLVDPRERTASRRTSNVLTAVYQRPVQARKQVEPQSKGRPAPKAGGWYSVPRDR